MVFGRVVVAERFITFDFPCFIFRVFGCGNKLLSWPKTNCVVDVLMAGTIRVVSNFELFFSCLLLVLRDAWFKVLVTFRFPRLVSLDVGFRSSQICSHYPTNTL